MDAITVSSARHTAGPIVLCAHETTNVDVQDDLVILKEEMKSLQIELTRTKRALDSRKTKLRVGKEDIAVAIRERDEAQEEIADLTDRLEKANTSVEQYRNWWVNEVQFTKLILNKVPNANQDWDLVRTSQAHYLGRF
jgi:chromosome segregation ATPase